MTNKIAHRRTLELELATVTTSLLYTGSEEYTFEALHASQLQIKILNCVCGSRT